MYYRGLWTLEQCNEDIPQGENLSVKPKYPMNHGNLESPFHDLKLSDIIRTLARPLVPRFSYDDQCLSRTIF